MKAHEVMNYQDTITLIIHASDILRMDGYWGEAVDLDNAADTMTELVERLRAEVANDG